MELGTSIRYSHNPTIYRHIFVLVWQSLNRFALRWVWKRHGHNNIPLRRLLMRSEQSELFTPRQAFVKWRACYCTSIAWWSLGQWSRHFLILAILVWLNTNWSIGGSFVNTFASMNLRVWLNVWLPVSNGSNFGPLGSMISSLSINMTSGFTSLV